MAGPTTESVDGRHARLSATIRSGARDHVAAKSRDLGKTLLLKKWYLDCVADNGDVAIVYLANLRWNKLTLHYGSLLTAIGGDIHYGSSLRKESLPKLDRDAIILTSRHLGAEGTWQALRAPIKRRVFEGKNGNIDWCCHHPKSQVSLMLPGKTRMIGLGYAESLSLSVLPWRLPLEELHWGRFLSEHHSLVWIDWRGPYQWRTVVHNGDEVEIQSLTESRIVLAQPGVKVELDQGLLLRSGRLGETVFAGVSRLAKVLPHSMLSVKEWKWRSRARLHIGSVVEMGWAIHEVVRWNW